MNRLNYILIFLLLSFTNVFAETITFDLGGPCLQQATPRNYSDKEIKKIQDANQFQQWDILIEVEKQSVREDCSIPGRWEFLFKKIIMAKRYKEGVGVLNEMKKRGIFFPHVLIAKTDSNFLKTEEFIKSEIGLKFQKEQKLIDKLIAEAKIKIDSMKDSDKPPKLYVSEGACPFECCQYGKWKTRKSVKIFKEIRSTNLAFEIPAGVEVNALTGKVLKDPEPYVVLETIGVVKQGDILFTLNYFGEGAINYWYNGKLAPDLKTEISTNHFYENDQSNSDDLRWLKQVYPEKSFADEWWAKIRTKEGIEGWVRPEGLFDGTDACGH